MFNCVNLIFCFFIFISIFCLFLSLIFRLLLHVCGIDLFFLLYLFIHPLIYFQKIASDWGSYIIIIIIITSIISYYYHYQYYYYYPYYYYNNNFFIIIFVIIIIIIIIIIYLFIYLFIYFMLLLCHFIFILYYCILFILYYIMLLLLYLLKKERKMILGKLAKCMAKGVSFRKKKKNQGFLSGCMENGSQVSNLNGEERK